ncbi:MAG: hypothetical protein WBC95_01495 [Albidovulum sp.]
MKLLQLLGIRPPVATTLPAGKYAFLHMFDQDAGGFCVKGTCQLSEVSLLEQIKDLSNTMDLTNKNLVNIDLNELTVATYLTPITENKPQFSKGIRKQYSRKLSYLDGFVGNDLFGVESWSYRDENYCASWLIELNLHDPELLHMITSCANVDVV